MTDNRQVLRWPSANYRARLLVTGEPERDADCTSVGLACRQLNSDGTLGHTVLLAATLHHGSFLALAGAMPGDEIQGAGNAEQVDTALQLGYAVDAATVVIVNPMRSEVWRRVDRGPTAPTNPDGSATA